MMSSTREAEFGILIARDVMVPMRDGVKLATDIYRPARDDEPLPEVFPALLLRHPLRQERPAPY